MTHTIETKAKAFALYVLSKHVRKTAREVAVSPASIVRWRDQSHWWKTGKLEKKKKLIRKQVTYRKVTSMFLEETKKYFASPQPCCAKEALFQINKTSCCKVSISTFRRVMKNLNIRKKQVVTRIFGVPCKEAVDIFKERYAYYKSQNRLFVSVDESYVSEKVRPLHVYCFDDVEPIPSNWMNKGSWKQRTLIQAIGSNGHKYSEVVDGSVNRDRFSTFIQNMTFPINSVILMDNCSIHKSIEHIFKQRGYEILFLPPYSPGFQPVEYAFSKIKRRIRSLWPWINSLERAIHDSVATLSASDIFGFLGMLTEISKIQNSDKIISKCLFHFPTELSVARKIHVSTAFFT